jgi:hypothetical protein
LVEKPTAHFAAYKPKQKSLLRHLGGFGALRFKGAMQFRDFGRERRDFGAALGPLVLQAARLFTKGLGHELELWQRTWLAVGLWQGVAVVVPCSGIEVLKRTTKGPTAVTKGPARLH